MLSKNHRPVALAARSPPRTQHNRALRIIAHVGVTEGQVDLQPARKQRHGTRSSSLSAASQGALASAICTVTNIGAGFSSCFQRNITRAAIP